MIYNFKRCTYNVDRVFYSLISFRPLPFLLCVFLATFTGSALNANDLTPQTTPPLHSRSPQAHLSADISPPTNRQNNDSQSPPIPGIGSKGMLSLRDVIAKSITRTFSQQNAEALNKTSIDHLDQYKRPSISVIKNLGGTDLSRYLNNLFAHNTKLSLSVSIVCRVHVCQTISKIPTETKKLFEVVNVCFIPVPLGRAHLSAIIYG